MIAMKNLIPLTIFFLLSFSTFAQKNLPKLISAQKQDWAGGIAGHRGTHYYLTVNCYDTTWKPEFLKVNDQVWYDSTSTFSSKRIANKRSYIQYKIVANYSTNDVVDMPHLTDSKSQYVQFRNHKRQIYRLPIKRWENLPFGNYP